MNAIHNDSRKRNLNGKGYLVPEKEKRVVVVVVVVLRDQDVVL
jgi:hypothetical protein